MSKMRILLLISIISITSLGAVEALRPPPPEKIEKQIEKAQSDLEAAEKMFIPWYTGPLLTGSANNAQPGQYAIQPYLFITNNYGAYNANRKSQSIPNLIVYKPLLILQTGITKWLDVALTLQGLHNRQRGKSATNFGDSSVQVGYQALKQKPYVPSIRATLTESFPTGNYEKLNGAKGGVDATGSGSFETSLGLNFSKVFWWSALHPINLRSTFTWTMPAVTHVHGFNAYGGGFGTSGKVKPPNTLAIGFGAEVSITEKWVAAMDLAYFTTNKTSFSGTAGTTAAGLPATTGGPSSDQLSVAPAVEYNATSKLGVIGGVWFSVWGRNSSAFVSGILSLVYVF